MGWTEYRATHYNKYGVDRKAECREYFKGNEKWATLLKDAMVGTTWYGAVKLTSTGEVFAMVMLTSVRNRTEFAYKEMSDTAGPYAHDCPESILKLLSPTDNECAVQWRERCRERHQMKKNLAKATRIRMTYAHDTKCHKKGDTVELHRGKVKHLHKYWFDNSEYYYTPVSMILSTGFEVVA